MGKVRLFVRAEIRPVLIAAYAIESFYFLAIYTVAGVPYKNYINYDRCIIRAITVTVSSVASVLLLAPWMTSNGLYNCRALSQIMFNTGENCEAIPAAALSSV